MRNGESGFLPIFMNRMNSAAQSNKLFPALTAQI